MFLILALWHMTPIKDTLCSKGLSCINSWHGMLKEHKLWMKNLIKECKFLPVEMKNTFLHLSMKWSPLDFT